MECLSRQIRGIVWSDPVQAVKEVAGIRTYFFYSDEDLVGEYDGGGTEIKSYGYKPDSIWMTDPLFMKQGDQYYFYHYDHLGTPQQLYSPPQTGPTTSTGTGR